MRSVLCGLLCVPVLGLMVGPAHGVPAQQLRDLRPALATTPPVLDGTLDDAIWAAGPTVEDVFITYSPVDGDVLPQSTAVYLAYDPDNLYFAFHCRDSRPEQIKTSLTKHDNLWKDDWIGLSLDTVNGKQFAYDLFVNPSGMQADIYRSGNGEDSAPDWVWHTAAKVMDDGYVVEMRLPLKSFRFRSGRDVEKGVLFWRRISRLGLSGAWPEIGLEKGVFNSMARVVYGNLDQQLQLEVLPSATSGALWDRTTPSAWSDAEQTGELGLSVRYGITSGVSAEATLNPDFSHVESDTFQVVANQRYPIFYQEKRPFFMESGHQFEIAGTTGDSNMRRAVHTRTIVDPDWGAKLTGETSRASFAFLAASDAWAGREPEAAKNHLGESALFTIGRARYSIGGDSYVGGLYSGRELVGDYDRVWGADFRLRLRGKHRLAGHYLHSRSQTLAAPGPVSGSAYSVMYDHFDKPLGLFAQVERVDEPFRMDTAFINRRGVVRLTGYLGPQFYPQSPRLSWIRRINPFFFGHHTHDLVTGQDDAFGLLSLRCDFTRQGHMRLDVRWHREHWQGRRFEQTALHGSGGAQLTKWLNLGLSVRRGESVYYDTDDPFLGRGLRAGLELTLQRGDRLAQGFDYTYEFLDRASDGARQYDLHILVSRTTFQFSKQAFLRALVQYDSYRRVVLSDLLASLTVVPGTVFHVGYGSLHERAEWLQGQWLRDPGRGRYRQMSRSFFVKGAYRWRF